MGHKKLASAICIAAIAILVYVALGLRGVAQPTLVCPEFREWAGFQATTQCKVDVRDGTVLLRQDLPLDPHAVGEAAQPASHFFRFECGSEAFELGDASEWDRATGHATPCFVPKPHPEDFMNRWLSNPQGLRGALDSLGGNLPPGQGLISLLFSPSDRYIAVLSAKVDDHIGPSWVSVHTLPQSSRDHFVRILSVSDTRWVGEAKRIPMRTATGSNRTPNTVWMCWAPDEKSVIVADKTQLCVLPTTK